MIPAVINALHFFEDGNGRTSRIVHLLLRGFETKDEFMTEARKALGEYGRFDSYDINPGLVSFEVDYFILKKYGWEFNEERQGVRLGKIESGFATVEFDQIRVGRIQHPLSQYALEFHKLYRSDAHVGLTALRQALGDECIVSLQKTYDDSVMLSPLTMLEILKPEEWAGLLDAFYDLKKEKVHILIDMFEHPDAYRLKPFFFDRDVEVNLKDYFIKRVKSEYDKNQQAHK